MSQFVYCSLARKKKHNSIGIKRIFGIIDVFLFERRMGLYEPVIHGIVPCFIYRNSNFQPDIVTQSSGVGNCPILGILDITIIVAIIDHIPNGWVMFNGDI